jgi:hypothetical protein
MLRRSNVISGTVLGVLLLLAMQALAAETTKRRHATILARALSYELTLSERVGPTVGVAVVYKPGNAQSEGSAADWLGAFDELSSVRIKDKSFFAIRVPNDGERLAQAIEKEGVDVLLVTDGLASEAKSIANLARSRHVLTVGSNLSYVEADLTLCVLEENERTRIFINLGNAGLEGIRFSSNLLKLANLVR